MLLVPRPHDALAALGQPLVGLGNGPVLGVDGAMRLSRAARAPAEDARAPPSSALMQRLASPCT
eukprot:6578711-Lingulodinium_polyedra.AAC.1